jgi:hypothetical protein
MSEDERLRFIHLPPPHAAGPQIRHAVDLRAGGMRYQDIATELGVNLKTANRYVREGLDRFLAEEIRSSDVARRLHVERLRALLAAQWPKAMTGDVNASATCLKIIEREARLLGLDAPARIDVTARIRQMAVEEGLDPDEAVEEAQRIVKGLPR